MLTDNAIRNAIKATRGAGKPRKLSDSGGLYLLLKPSKDADGVGAWWRWKYRFAGKEKLLSLGVYPDVPLKRAREKRDDARRMLADEKDPSAERQAKREAMALTFEHVAAEHLAQRKHELSAKTWEKQKWMVEKLLNPRLGSRPISELAADEVLAALRAVESRGHFDTTHRAKQLVGRICRFAIATGRRKNGDPSADLRGALKAPVVTHHAAVTDPVEVGNLLQAISSYQGQPATMYALRLTPLVFVRPGELRAAEWDEFTLTGDSPEWRIPAERMKMGELHIVPLSTQAVEVLKELHVHTGHGKYLFPSLRSPMRPMSNNTVNAALRRLGYAGDEQTGHGFRTIASTLLNEMGYAPDVIELQLAHAERNKVRAAYNRAQRMPERRKMMQAWADHLDSLRSGGSNVVTLKRASGA